MFVDRTVVTISAPEYFTRKVYSKLMTRRRGPYCVLCIELEYLKILQEGVVNFTSFKRVTKMTGDESIPDHPLSKAVGPMK